MTEVDARGVRPILTTMSATLIVCFTLMVSVFIVGPMVRHWLGEPRDFNRDYVSREALQQALVSQGVSLAVAFMLFGLSAKAWGSRQPLKWCLLAANPLTIGLGYGLYRFIAMSQGTAEYFGFFGWAWLSLLSPILFAPVAFLGTRIARERTSASKADSAL